LPARDVAIVGAGIGGLTAALALRRLGCNVVVFERRGAFDELGAGIQLSPNATRILRDLDLSDRLNEIATAPPAIVVHAIGSGREIGRIALGAYAASRFGAPYLVAARADLHRVLVEAARHQGVTLELGLRALATQDAAGPVKVLLARDDGARETMEADLVVGADGMGSVIRAALTRAAPVFSGWNAWRATLPQQRAPEGLSGPETGLWLGPSAHIVHYPIGGRLNVVAVAEGARPVEGWSAPGDPALIRRLLADAAPPLRELVTRIGEWAVWSLVDLPDARMGRGRVALLGDAAHPVLPFLAQGAALAIEDAAVLAACLARSEQPVEECVAAYGAARRPRVRRVQEEARRNARLYHATGPLAWTRDAAMRALGANGVTRRYDWLYGWRAPAPAADTRLPAG
jgi:salicylate hydroxylase